MRAAHRRPLVRTSFAPTTATMTPSRMSISRCARARREHRGAVCRRS
jgi:hypothetical protein